MLVLVFALIALSIFSFASVMFITMTSLSSISFSMSSIFTSFKIFASSSFSVLCFHSSFSFKALSFVDDSLDKVVLSIPLISFIDLVAAARWPRRIARKRCRPSFTDIVSLVLVS